MWMVIRCCCAPTTAVATTTRKKAVVGGVLIVVLILSALRSFDYVFHFHGYLPIEIIQSTFDDKVDLRWTDKPSRIEMTEEEFMVLRNVCLTIKLEGRYEYILHFFGPMLDPLDVASYLNDNGVPYSAWESDILKLPSFEGIPSARLMNTTIQQFLADRGDVNASIVEGTTIIAEPHHPDNNFHLHNDLMLPVLYKILKSSTRYRKTLLLTHGCRWRYEQRVIAFDILHHLFDEVRYPLEQILREDSGGVMCFERVVLGGRAKLPYLSHVGRFGTNDRWKGVIPAIRDWVNTVHGIDVKVTLRHFVADTTASIKPSLTFIDRPCSESSGRCLRNITALTQYFSRRFNVNILSFDGDQSRSDQLTSMLQQMASTDILVGMHGAGLAHIAYLQPGTLLVEIKDESNREKKLFLNMASKQDVGYYLFDASPAMMIGPNTALSDDEMESFTEDLWQAWEQEQEYLLVRNTSDPVLKWECLFPQLMNESHSTLSSFRVSRCYLEEYSNDWWQCTYFSECTADV